MRISDWSSDMCSSDLEELARLHEILQTLPPKCRQAFELKKFQDFSQRRIAEHMGIAESTVEKHLAKALRLVSDGMKQAPAGAQDGRQRERRVWKWGCSRPPGGSLGGPLGRAPPRPRPRPAPRRIAGKQPQR